ncbi:MAG: pantoate kinase [Candidatus Hermodarchaeota archaeon]
MLRSRVFVPGHATCFFSSNYHIENPLKTGSIGVGFCTARGSYITVEYEASGNERYVQCYEKGKRVNFPVSSETALEYLKRSNINGRVTIYHELGYPIKTGLGMSASGSLGTAIALNSILETLTPLETHQLAHIIEVKHHTGLGDVIAQLTGGFEARTRAGGPGYGKIKRFDIETEILLIFFGSLETKTVLADEKFHKKANEIGKTYLQEFLKEPSPRKASILGRQFCEETNLLTSEISSFIKLFPADIARGMILIGNTAYVFTDDIETFLLKFPKIKKYNWQKTKLSSNGAVIC